MFFKNTQPRVLCIGSSSIDLFFPTDEGEIIETPEDLTSQRKIAFEVGGKVLAPEIHTNIGGVAANVSIGLARLSIDSAAYSCLGGDSNGSFCMAVFKSEGVDSSRVKIIKEARTDLSAIIVLPGGERTIIHNRDANKRLEVELEKLEGEWIFLSSLNGEWQNNIERILSLVRERNKSKKVLRLAYNPGLHNIKDDPAQVIEAIRAAEVLVLNKDETLELALHDLSSDNENIQDEQFLLGYLHQKGAKIVALTDGKRGAWASDGKNIWYQEAPENIPLVESTGAGDAFTTGFLAGHLQGCPLDQCLRFGVANSLSVIQQFGTTPGLLFKQGIESAITHLIPQKIS